MVGPGRHLRPCRGASRRLVLAALSASLLVLGAGCKGSPSGVEGRLEPGGTTLLTEAGGKQVSVTGSRPLRRGDRIEVAEGAVVVALPSGASLELQPRAVVEFDGGPHLVGGGILVDASKAAQPIVAAVSDVDVRGIARFSVGLTLTVGVYRGTAGLRSGGASLDLPALRQVAVPAVGVVPATPDPLSVSVDDPWDKRFLPAVVRHLDSLEFVSRGFTAQTGEGRTVGFYRRLLPALDAESSFQQAFVDRVAAPGDVLVGAAVALVGRRGSVAERLAGAAEFRGRGAPWALVAADQGVEAFDDLERLVAEAIGGAARELAATPPTTATTTPPRTTPTTRRTTPTTAPPATTSTSPTTAPSTTPTSVPPTSPPTTAPPSVLAPLDPIVGLLDALLGGP